MPLISFEGIVGQDFNLESISEILSGVHKGDDLDITINSEGGSHIEAIRILNALIGKQANITTTIESHAFSAGYTLALAGNRIRMHENALLLIHPVSASNISGSPEELRIAAEMTEKAQETLLLTLTARTSKTRKEMSEIINNTTIMTAKEAKEGGLIDEIVSIRTRKVNLKNLEAFCEKLPDRIVAHVRSFEDSFKKEATMPLLNVAKKLQLDVVNVAEDDTAIEAVIVNAFEQRTSKINKLQKEVDDLKKVPAPIAKESVKVPAIVVNMCAKLRKQEINSLLREGYLTRAGAETIMRDWANPDNLSNFLDADGNETDKFNNLVNTLRQNGKVVNLDGNLSLGVQSLPNLTMPVGTDGKPVKEENLLTNLIQTRK